MRIAPRSVLNSVPPDSVPRIPRALCALLVLACMAGCGIKGPLYLSKPPKAARQDVSKTPAAAASAPAVPAASAPAVSQPE